MRASPSTQMRSCLTQVSRMRAERRAQVDIGREPIWCRSIWIPIISWPLGQSPRWRAPSWVTTRQIAALWSSFITSWLQSEEDATIRQKTMMIKIEISGEESNAYTHRLIIFRCNLTDDMNGHGRIVTSSLITLNTIEAPLDGSGLAWNGMS